MIEYRDANYSTGRTVYSVLLEKRKVGEIRKVHNGWIYVPKGQREAGQPVHSTLDACKLVLQ